MEINIPVKTSLAVSAIMAHEVLAEGVKMQEQLDFLRELRCQYIQGYYFNKPWPLVDFESLLNSRTLQVRHKSLKAICEDKLDLELERR